MTSNKNARFCFNNYVEDGIFSVSSANSSYPSTNLTSGIRSRVWQAAGNFEISATNNKVYIDSTTYTLTSGHYTAATLITHFNSVTGKTLARNSFGRFTINGTSMTLNLTSTTNAIWQTIGFLGTADVTGTSFTADERRYNNGEWIKVDVGPAQKCTFAALIPPNEAVFQASTASITLQGNNIDNWASPQVSVAMEVSSVGAFACPNVALDACRYWRIYINDVKNSAISASVAYIGDSVITSNTNFSSGFSSRFVDQSIKLYSEGGQLYVDRKPRYRTLDSCQIMLLKDEELVEVRQLYFDLGQGRPFFVVLDPEKRVSMSLSDMTHYVQVDGDPVFTHVFSGYHNLSFALRECI